MPTHSQSDQRLGEAPEVIRGGLLPSLPRFCPRLAKPVASAQGTLLVAWGMAFALFGGLPAARAQTTSTQILGTVLDSSGAAVHGAAVQAHRVGTVERRSATTDDSGGYVIPSLEIGQYEVSVEASGFQREVKRGIVLEVNQKARIDFKLIVGSVTQTVEVLATAPVLKTDDATVGDVVDERRITELPLNGRDFTQLTTVSSPGVRSTASFIGTTGIIAAGQKLNQNQVTMDGVVIQSNLLNSTSMRPSIEAIEEFKVQAANFSAEFGNFSGAQVNVALRSGTNELHGTAFEFLRNKIFDARNFFERPTDPKRPLRRNQFGGVLAGPVFLPGIYNGRDRTFFMFNAEFLRHRLSGSTPTVVIPMAFREGNFSSLLGGGKTIRDPQTGQPFTGNIIPRDRLSPQALALLRYQPQPNQAGVTNYLVRTRNNESNDQYLGRLDHVFGEGDRLFGRYIHQRKNLDTVTSSPFDIRPEGTTDWNTALNYIHVFSTTTINEFRAGYSLFDYLGSNQFATTNFSILKEFGMAGYSDDPLAAGLPNIAISGYLGFNSNGPEWHRSDTLQLADNLSLIRGNHAFKIGVDIRRDHEVERNVNLPRGSISFTGDMTGDPVADFMLGLPRQVSGVETLLQTNGQNWKYSGYFLDDWKVTPRLTLNLGVRYQLATVLRDPGGTLRSLDPRDPTKLYPEFGVSVSLYDGDHNNFAPRIGFAYRPFGTKLVFRGGYGMYYNSNQVNNFTILARNPPVFQAPVFFSEPATPSLTLADPFSPKGTLQSRPFNIVSMDTCHCFPNDYSQMWTFNIERQVTENFGFEVGYVGMLAVHLNHSDGPNFPEPGPGTIQPRRPIPTWGTIRMLRNDGAATDQELQVQAKRRFSKGLLFVINYAWGHNITDVMDVHYTVGSPDFRRRYLERASSSWDITHFMTASFVYQLPFFAHASSPLLHHLLGEWQANGIVTLASGLPFTVSASGDPANNGAPQRADRLRDGNLPNSQRTLDRWFDTAAFAQPQQYTLGNSGRYILRRAGSKVFDFGFFKNFHVRERNTVQFRSEFFSLFNTPQFGPPGTTVTTPAFGRVTSASGNRVIQFGLKYSF